MQTQLLKTVDATKVLGLSKAFLERDRWAGAKVPFIKIGDRAVRYRMEDLEFYIQSRMRMSTSDDGQQ